MIAANKTRLTSAGNIKATPGMLHWLIISNANSNTRHCTLHDDNDGTSDEVIKFYIPGQRTIPFYFDPPLPFAIGIRIGAMEHDETVVTGGYS